MAVPTGPPRQNTSVNVEQHATQHAPRVTRWPQAQRVARSSQSTPSAISIYLNIRAKGQHIPWKYDLVKCVQSSVTAGTEHRCANPWSTANTTAHHCCTPARIMECRGMGARCNIIFSQESRWHSLNNSVHMIVCQKLHEPATGRYRR
jgi:hypothetical protein